MVEETKSGGYTIGHLRMKYIDAASILYANAQTINDYLGCRDMLNNFIDTIKEDGKAAIELTTGLDKINRQKEQQIVDLETAKKNVGYLERKDFDEQRERIEINAIHDMKTLCWIVALEYGLFYER